METENLITEEWREVEGHPGYFVSNCERLRHGARILYGCVSHGRRVVSFGRNTETFFHVVVAKAFPEICGNWFEGCHVHHKDFNPLHNTPDNLIVMTGREHLQLHYQHQPDSFRKASEKRSKSISKALRGRRAPEKHIPILQYTLDGVLVKEWECICDVTYAGYSPGNVCMCCRGKLKTAYGFKWSYK